MIKTKIFRHSIYHSPLDIDSIKDNTLENRINDWATEHRVIIKSISYNITVEAIASTIEQQVWHENFHGPDLRNCIAEHALVLYEEL